MTTLLSDQEFIKLEQEYPFLRRAREQMNPPLETLTYIILDIETTGLDPVLHEITEIAAYKLENLEITGSFHSLIKPNARISAEITRLTGISDETVKDAPGIFEVLPKFRAFVDAHILVVHNSEFDLGFVNQQFLRNFNFELGNQSICTVKIARAILKTLVNHKLHTVAEYFGIPMQNRHRAQGDATILIDVWRNLIRALKKNHISTILDLRKSAWIS